MFFYVCSKNLVTNFNSAPSILVVIEVHLPPLTGFGIPLSKSQNFFQVIPQTSHIDIVSDDTVSFYTAEHYIHWEFCHTLDGMVHNQSIRGLGSYKQGSMFATSVVTFDAPWWQCPNPVIQDSVQSFNLTFTSATSRSSQIIWLSKLHQKCRKTCCIVFSQLAVQIGLYKGKHRPS